MDTFAFIIHPIDPKRDVSRKFPFLGRVLSEKQIDFFSTFFPPVYISEIEGIASQTTGKQVKGWFLACPYTPRRMMQLPERAVYRKIIQTGIAAEKLGAQILGLGAFTSVVGDAGVTIAKHLDIPVTTGDSYTVMMAVQAIREAAKVMDIKMADATVAVVGATGSIGRADLEWTVSPPDSFRATLHRSVAGTGAWTALDTLDANPEGHLAYTDTTVAPGTTYTYRLGVSVEGVEAFYGQATVFVPSGLRLALGVQPNPTDGAAASLSFTLPYAEPATVEVFDLTGRLVDSRRLDGFGAATHVVPFALWPSARSGVYLVRITQRGQSLTSRVSIVR